MSTVVQMPLRTDYAERLPPDCLMSECGTQQSVEPLVESSVESSVEPSVEASLELRTDALVNLNAATLRLPGHCFGPFSLRLQAGERVAILGPSGAGKSTLLKLMSAEYAAHSGEVFFEGQVLRAWQAADLARRRAVLPQSHAVAFDLPVSLVVSLGRVARLHDPDQALIVTKALQLAQAGHLAARRFDTLSGGEQARVQLARIFAQLWEEEGALLLVDEPLASLDPGLQFDLMDAMQTFSQARGHALVAVLHDINQALSSFDRLWLINQGRMQADIAPDADAVPTLEALYGIGLRTVLSTESHPGDQGGRRRIAVVPYRRARSAVVATSSA